ncbi:MAG: metallophosphoesterase family protein [Alphaproteobacteria bacterium]
MTPSPSAPTPRVPQASRIYVIGDIHGRADLLDRLHDLITTDARAHPAARKRVVYLGDYLDRGYQSREVVECLLARPLEGLKAVHLRGNHEKMMLDFLEDSTIGLNWLMIGGDATLYSYGVGKAPRAGRRDDLDTVQRAFRDALPQSHLDFFRGLETYHVEGDYLFVHAGVRPGVALAKQEVRDLLWIREEFLNSTADHGKMVVHGHSIVVEPETRANRIAIDTGAFATGRLTCLVLDGDTRAFLGT